MYVCVWVCVDGLIVVCCVCVGGRVNCGVLCVWVAGAWLVGCACG